jgi:hypothetical protein
VSDSAAHRREGRHPGDKAPRRLSEHRRPHNGRVSARRVTPWNDDQAECGGHVLDEVASSGMH